MHLAPSSRRRAFRKLVTLLKPGAWLAISFRQADPGNPRSMFPCHVDELEQLARIHGTFIERVETASDQFARTGIEWTRVVIRLPDDGTGALPVIRHIILKDSKSSACGPARSSRKIPWTLITAFLGPPGRVETLESIAGATIR